MIDLDARRPTHPTLRDTIDRIQIIKQRHEAFFADETDWRLSDSKRAVRQTRAALAHGGLAHRRRSSAPPPTATLFEAFVFGGSDGSARATTSGAASPLFPAWTAHIGHDDRKEADPVSALDFPDFSTDLGILARLPHRRHRLRRSGDRRTAARERIRAPRSRCSSAPRAAPPASTVFVTLLRKPVFASWRESVGADEVEARDREPPATCSRAVSTPSPRCRTTSTS